MDDPIMARIIAEDLEREELEPDVWTMSNHKWALYAWASAQLGQPAALVHLDWHWDGINDFRDGESKAELLQLDSLESLEEMIADRDRRICYASFIAPALILELIDEVHFYCLQDDTTPGLDADLLVAKGVQEYCHATIDELLTSTSGLNKPILFDLDIDLFNRATPFFEEGDAHLENIREFLLKCSDLIQRASVITIAKSPANYWIRNEGELDWDDSLAERLFDEIVPLIRSIRSAT